VAIPSAGLDGDFHDKFGIFRDRDGNAVAFHGSPDDSEQAFRNYESLSIYYTWVDEREDIPRCRHTIGLHRRSGFPRSARSGGRRRSTWR
jgi:hypothetical protein